MSTTLIGPIDWDHSRDRDGHREYNLTWLIECTNAYVPSVAITDPRTIAETAGLPQVGSLWSDLNWITGSDDWAWCSPEYNCRPYGVQAGEAPNYYAFTNKFSTRPWKRCQDTEVGNPIFEPPDISGSWVEKKIYPIIDRNGDRYCTRAGEPIQGTNTEIDDSDWDLNISFNTFDLPLGLINSLRHHLNDSIMWGLPVATIKFSKYSFSRKIYGSCNYYYTHNMGFSIRPSWDQSIPEFSQKELITGGDPLVPTDWIRRKDLYGENVPLLQLATDGTPFVDPDTQTMSVITRQPYTLGNLFLLGVPTTL